jgi:hypothetical protein
MGDENGGQARRPEKRRAVKVPSPLLRKARMVATSQGVDVRDYLEKVLRPALERDYEQIFEEAQAEDVA